MANFSPCRSCGRRSFRYRKRTDDFICRNCGACLLRGDIQPAAPTLQHATTRKRSGGNARPEREVARTLTDLAATLIELEAAVHDISKQHDPFGFMPVALALASGAIVADVILHSVRMYLVVLISLGLAVLVFIVLMFFRLSSWIRHHPLLVQRFKSLHPRAGEGADFDRIGLSEVIVRHYLSAQRAEALLARFEAKKQRALNLLGPEEFAAALALLATAPVTPNRPTRPD